MLQVIPVGMTSINFDEVVHAKAKEMRINVTRVCNAALKEAVGMGGDTETEALQKLKITQNQVRQLALLDKRIVQTVAVEERAKVRELKGINDRLIFWSQVLNKARKAILFKQTGVTKESTPEPPKENTGNAPQEGL